VLDSLDANDSLFIVAPTSSGKTFISFYAMKQILQADDDGVLVYVAPTKALVNQIAAEVQARFQKNLRHEGRSVWAIHTRDYRINNPTGCQILVTVPHVLQIMLLAPSNATGNNAWSKRVRRIIFDEVHCIGQADDGIIWEQLLLMAPCPIIALSATVGNPEEFYEWLKISQTSKGFQLKMITHSTRYSDLRAFQYVPPKCFVFKGLASVDKFPVPGLGLPNNTNSNFRFIHPIATLVHR
jgi:superfamily II RNA helicase